MDNKPLVSICCLTYNHSKYIRDCIDGFLMQETNFSFEIIVHDDASTDGTINIIKDYVFKHPGFFITIFQSENKFSKGIKPIYKYVFPKAKGKYIALCEGDDYWTDPLKLQKQIDFIENNQNVSAVFHNAEMVSDGNFLSYHCNYSSSQVIPDEKVIFRGGGLFPTASLLFRNFFKNNPSKGDHNYLSGDRALIYQLLLIGKIYYLNEIMSVYRIHDQGIYSSSLNDSQKWLKIRYSNIDLLKDYSKKFGTNHKKYFKKTISYQWKSILMKENGSLLKIISKFPELRMKDFISLIYNKIN
ncbi:MAG: glycosyltransferase [Mongoliitalea sp.]